MSLKESKGFRPRILMIFVDGIGLGVADPSFNPFARSRRGFEVLSGGRRWTKDADSFQSPHGLFRGIDACLGLEGLPQSGTGQATLFTGVNCAAVAGRHYGPFPHSATREIIRTGSIFARLGASRSTFANSFPPKFFQWTGRSGRWPVITRACLDANVRIRTLEDLQRGHGIAADITGRGLSGFADVKVISPGTAAERLLRMTEEADFTLFEIFHTDKAGHAQDSEAAESIMRPLDALLEELAAGRPARLSIVLCSDHGNLEDLSVRTHTRNEVPLAVLGPAAPAFHRVRSLTDVAPAILRSLS